MTLESVEGMFVSRRVRRFTIHGSLLRTRRYESENFGPIGPLDRRTDESAEPLSELGRVFVNRIFAEIPGVAKVRTVTGNVNAIDIKLARAFEWRDIQQRVEELMAIIVWDNLGDMHMDCFRELPDDYTPPDQPTFEEVNRVRFFETKSDHILGVSLSRRLLKMRHGNDEIIYFHPIKPAIDAAEASELPVDEAGRRLVNRIFRDVPGVLEVRIRPYEMHIKVAVIATAFEAKCAILPMVKDEVFGQVEMSFSDDGRLWLAGGEFTHEPVLQRGLKRLRWRETKSDRVHWYGVSDRLVENQNWNKECFFSGPVTDADAYFARKGVRLTERARNLINRIFGLSDMFSGNEGVIEICVRAYELNVRISANVEWHAVHHHILSCIIEELFDTSKGADIGYDALVA